MMGGEPWNQGIEEEDFFVEGADDEADELGVDFHTPIEDVEAPAPRAPAVPRMRAPAGRGPVASPNRKYRIKAMGQKLAARSKGVASILITKMDGSQVLLVRKGN